MSDVAVNETGLNSNIIINNDDSNNVLWIYIIHEFINVIFIIYLSAI